MLDGHHSATLPVDAGSGGSRGGGRSRRAPPQNTLKSPLNLLQFTKKILGARPKTPGAPLLQILDPPLAGVQGSILRHSLLLVHLDDMAENLACVIRL